MRTFPTGATRDDDTDKIDYDGHLSLSALAYYGAYMHRHRKQADGTMRAADNWKSGIPLDAYRKSLLRHTIDAVRAMADDEASDYTTDPKATMDLLSAVIFNAFGALHEYVSNEEIVAGLEAIGPTPAAILKVGGPDKHGTQDPA